ncbi:MAG TPA: glycoside hydrolase family 38 C-terminal domain-containing protein [Candidatus Saccharimonadales bacterium]|nr:glycoside hydrolase family 38 C-terminal domain-containing protein [Candidatus Saccharimonadales bacterium]
MTTADPEGRPRPARAAVSRPTLHLIGNSHIDPVWLWRWPEGLQEIRATFRSALDRMTEYPEFIFTCDSVAYYEWILEIDPAMFAEIQARVAEGRWELVGGWWVEPDCNLPGGESFVRQALLGQRFFLEHFGRIATVGYNVDPFGHHAMLPQLLQRSGMDSYVFMRPGPHEAHLPAPVFWWESPDGSRVLTYRLPHEYCAPREDLGNHLDKSIAQLPERWTEMMAFYGVGNHGGGPTRENLDSIRRLDGAGAMPVLRHSTPERFFAAMRAAPVERPVHRDDLQHHAVGCYSAHSGIKRWMRRAENDLSTAEAWSAVASWVTDQPYPADELGRAWRQVLFNQFHDTLGGTAIEPAYEDARDQLGEASSIAARRQNVAIQGLARLIDIPTDPRTKPILVFNPHAWPVTTTVELEFGGLQPTDGLVDDEGRSIGLQPVQSYATVAAWRSRFAFEAELPALGYRTYAVVAGAPRPEGPPLRAEGTILENPHVRLELDPVSGAIISLVARADGRDVVEVMDPAGSRAVIVDDTSDTWGHRRLAYADELESFRTTKVELIESGPVRATLRVDAEAGASRLVQDYVLGASARWVEVRVNLDWREHARMLKLRYPTAVADPVATYEIPYGAIERPADGDEEPGQRWIDVSGPLQRGEPKGPDVDEGATGGLAILNDGKYAFDVRGAEAGVTAVRSPIYAHHEPMTPREGVRYQFQDQGLQRFTLGLVPHQGAWAEAGLTRHSLELNQRPTVLLESYHAGPLPRRASYVSVTPDHLVVGALKVAEDGDDLIVRLVETAGRPAAARVDLPAWDRSFTAEIGAFEIRTFQVSRDVDRAPFEVDLLERPVDPEPAVGQG